MVKKICSWIIGVILTVLVLFIGVFSFWYFGSTNYHLTGVPVLNYHQVNNKFNTVLTMKPADFEQQIKYLHDNDYHAITLEQFDAYMRGEGDLPDRPVLITFDDGYVDNYEDAYPILKKYHMRGTIFLIINLVGTPGYLTWDQVHEMAADGMEFGSHTMSHKPLTSFDRQGARYELQASKAAIEKATGKPCEFIAFPEGKYNDMVMEETKEAGYRYAFTVNTGRDFPWDDPYDLDRVPLFEGPISFNHFRFRLTFSAFSALLWKSHQYFSHIEITKDLPSTFPNHSREPSLTRKPRFQVHPGTGVFVCVAYSLPVRTASFRCLTLSVSYTICSDQRRRASGRSPEAVAVRAIKSVLRAA